MRRKIRQEVIPEIIDHSEETGDYVRTRKWFPYERKTHKQSTDTRYNAFKDYLSKLFLSTDDSTWIKWTKWEKCPITIEKLSFTACSCFQCGTIYETPDLEGKMKYKNGVYNYSGTVSMWERYCQCDEENAEGSSDFLFKLNLENCPDAMFIHLYTEVKDIAILP